ncbi:MAG: DedA family protein [Polyangiaceae bacterium]|jgi:membrane protein DedA with SNARE-associated domain|nr:DedA family protein [Polyangiaceae bacterium]
MLEALIVRWGYLAVVGGTFLEGETILVAAGALAHRGYLSLPWVMLCAFVGSVAGDQLWFQLGRRYGQPFLDRRPEWKRRAGTVQRHLLRFGDLFVLGFRFVVGIRTVTPALLGASGFSQVRFAWLNALGGAAWSAAVGGAGYALGAVINQALARAAHLEELLGAALLVGVLAAGGWKLWRRARGASTDSVG